MELDPLITSNIGKTQLSENKKPTKPPSDQESWNLEEFNQFYEYEKLKRAGIKLKVQTFAHNFSFLEFITSLFPFLKWIFKYDFCSDSCKDFIAGVTVAVMHIPQGMAYATLGGVDPIVGIYMAFFPVLVYFFMGTSRHISMGTFAVVCIMSGKPIMSLSKDGGSFFNDKTTDTVTPIYVATALTCSVGFWQVILGVLRLGSLSVLLSDTLISSFTTGAAFLVLTSQIKHVFGISLPRHSGPLKPVFTLIDVITMIKQTNYMSLGISLCIIPMLIAYNTYLKERVLKLLKAPIPVEFIIILLGTLGSIFGKLNEDYSVSVVGHIPVGFPSFNPPAIWLLFPYVWLDGLIIAVVSFSVNISMASIFARQGNYKVDANQELLASGCGNLLGSFYSCLPFAASLSRSVIQKSVGGVSQLASAVSSGILLTVMMYFAQFFEPLPHCVLAGIIIASLKQMFMQIKDLKKAWSNSYMDGLLWLITFLSVVLLDIDLGLGVGLFMSVTYLLLMGQDIKISLLGQVPYTDLYLDVDRYHKALPVSNILIIHLDGSLHFANNKRVTKKISKMIDTSLEYCEELHTLIIDMSGVGFVDSASIASLKTFEGEFLQEHQMKLLLARCSGEVFESLVNYKFANESNRNQLFPTIHDAVLFALKEANSAAQFAVVANG